MTMFSPHDVDDFNLNNFLQFPHSSKGWVNRWMSALLTSPQEGKQLNYQENFMVWNFSLMNLHFVPFVFFSADSSNLDYYNDDLSVQGFYMAHLRAARLVS